MGKITGFLEIERQDRTYAPVAERVRDYKEFTIPLAEPATKAQAARCMDCGIPYCHNGCPVHNQIPDWNDLVYHGDWEEAARNLHSTNNFPEFTGRICPAPCEQSCTLNLTDEPVTIKTIECAIADKAWENGWAGSPLLREKTGRQIAVIGSGPAGMAAAQQLARAGHDVDVFEKNARAGGLLRYGIPDFKMEKHLIDRRVRQMEEEGVTFHYGVNVGVDVSAKQLSEDYDAVILTGGAEKPRDLPVPGRELQGIHYAMDFLTQQNRRVSGENTPHGDPILATGKHVVVIGGGDTGSDCIGTSVRQGALSVTQLEILPLPPTRENKLMTWPDWPLKLRTSSSHQEGAEREFAVLTQGVAGENGKVTALNCVRVDASFKPIADTEFQIPADLVFLAMGFVSPIHEGLLNELEVNLDARGNVIANTLSYETSVPNVFVAGDMRRGQSLVVWAIREGRQAAHAVDAYLMGASVLPRI
ncbi:glutamate synthase subunit beta [Terrihabitans rhizophilus]|uniref:Glutamate synthase subunit beta n=1 Tax=Terrihabitans rhizophilus TaxID=3092662 RepID=A0ABU4RSL4_9HYPH|nr:glutamate synthase subunit beta [Terrihabitans sp. PJ23]MDX6806665.1 glutamate synthase subunit beta [Terrihabitans sp. PJ23]